MASEGFRTSAVIEFILKGFEGVAKANEALNKTAESAANAQTLVQRGGGEGESEENGKEALARRAMESAELAARAAALRRRAADEELAASRAEGVATKEQAESVERMDIAARRSELAAEKALSAAQKMQTALEHEGKSAGQLFEQSENLANASQNLLNIGSKLTGFAGAMIGALTGVVDKGLEFSGSLQLMSEKTGIAAEDLSKLRFAATSTEVPMESVTTAVARMDRAIDDAGQGSKQTAEYFTRLGISLTELKNVSVYDRFELIAEKLGQIPDPGERAAIAMRIFGRGAQDLLPLLNEGSKGLAEFSEQAKAMGLVIDNDAAKKAEDAQIKMRQFDAALQGIGATISNDLIPAILPLVTGLENIIGTVSSFAKAHPTLVQFVAISVTVLSVLLFMAGAISALGGLLSGFGAALSALGGAMQLFRSGATLSSVAMRLMGITAAESAVEVEGLGASMMAALGPALPIILAVGAGLAVIGGVAYLAKQNNNESSNSTAGSGEIINNTTSRTSGGVREYNINLKHQMSGDRDMDQHIDDRITQFARGFGGSPVGVGG